jgi:hypothetical protein
MVWEPSLSAQQARPQLIGGEQEPHPWFVKQRLSIGGTMCHFMLTAFGHAGSFKS